MENEVREYYNKYGIREWNRLEENLYSKINFLLHMHFIENDLHRGMRILDAGCGAGRYSIEFAKRGCQVTLFDISDEQLKIAEDKIEEANVREKYELVL
jgi:cyclopropane fatty-acyl-phospholipid synthase-like methyltransferase